MPINSMPIVKAFRAAGGFGGETAPPQVQRNLIPVSLNA